MGNKTHSKNYTSIQTFPKSFFQEISVFDKIQEFIKRFEIKLKILMKKRKFLKKYCFDIKDWKTSKMS